MADTITTMQMVIRLENQGLECSVHTKHMTNTAERLVNPVLDFLVEEMSMTKKDIRQVIQRRDFLEITTITMIEKMLQR